MNATRKYIRLQIHLYPVTSYFFFQLDGPLVSESQGITSEETKRQMVKYHDNNRTLSNTYFLNVIGIETTRRTRTSKRIKKKTRTRRIQFKTTSKTKTSKKIKKTLKIFYCCIIWDGV